MTDFVFYTICVIAGLNGWLAFPVAIDDQFSDLLQGSYRNPLTAPFRKLCLFGFAFSSMLCCALAWFSPQMAVFFGWVAVICSAGSALGPSIINHGPRGLVLLGRITYLSVALRTVAAIALTVMAPAVAAEG